MPVKFLYILLLFGWTIPTNLYGQSLYLTIKGNSDTETKTIDSLSYQKTFENYLNLENEVHKFKKKLLKTGYIESELIHLKKQNDSTYTALFHLNQYYETVRIYFDTSLNRNNLKLIPATVSDTYFDIKMEQLEHALSTLNAEISNQGDPFSTLQLTDIKKSNDGLLYAHMVIVEKNQRTIDSIIVKGYEKFPKSYVKHYLKIKQNQPFNLKTIQDKTSALENLQFANQIKTPEVLFTKDSTILYIYVEKQKSNAFDGFLGFGTNTETNKIEFDGYLNLNLVNNLNYGESFRLLYKSDEGQQQTFDVKARLPYLFGSPIGTELGLNIFKRDSSFVTVSQSARLEYQIHPKHQVAIGINALSSTNLLDLGTPLIADFKSTYYTINYLHLNSQKFDRLFPINFLFDMTAGFGSRTFEAVDEPQTKLDLNTFKIFNLNNKNSVYVRLNTGLLLSDTYLENELLRFGGINSIRGFEENSLLADLFSVINTEYRYRVSNSLYVHSVIDAAYFENKIFETQEKLFGFGFGFGLLTNAGLFKFNYTTAKTENQSFKLSDSKIHISLTALF